MTISRCNGIWKIQQGRLVVRCRTFEAAMHVFRNRTFLAQMNASLNQLLP